jgi:hypothetical protein
MTASEAGGRPRRWIAPDTLAAMGVAMAVTCLLAFAALQYKMPRMVGPESGVNQPGVEHFARHLFGKPPRPMRLGAFVECFRLLLLGAWAGYALAVGAGSKGGVLGARWTLPLTACLATGFATAFPPSLSTDVYAYVGFARLQAVYGRNPYGSPLAELEVLGDPTADFIKSDLRSVYGPVWAHLSAAIVVVSVRSGLWWQVVAMKLVAAASLLAAALVGRKVADHFAPGRGDLALTAIGLNPLFLIEGPGNGHNDLLMMALFLAGAWQVVKERRLPGAFLLGLSAGIKLVPIAVLPWVVTECAPWRERRVAVRRALAVGLLMLLPTVVGLVPLWRGPATLGPVLGRLRSSPPDPRAATAGRPAPDPRPASALARQVPVLVVYAALSGWLALRRVEGGWLDAWAVLSGCLIVWTMGVIFPWYVVWPWTVLLTRWDRPRVLASAICLVLSFSQVWQYSFLIISGSVG